MSGSSVHLGRVVSALLYGFDGPQFDPRSILSHFSPYTRMGGGVQVYNAAQIWLMVCSDINRMDLKKRERTQATKTLEVGVQL